MTRFKRAVEEWRKIRNTLAWNRWLTVNLSSEFSVPRLEAEILIDVVKAVDAYERTIAQLKAQNSKLRRCRKESKVPQIGNISGSGKADRTSPMGKPGDCDESDNTNNPFR